jgi:hypothetical protein
VEAASWLPMRFNRAEEPQEVRYLRVISEPLGEDDDAVLEFSVHCPRRGITGVEDCMDCSHGGRLRHHGRRGRRVAGVGGDDPDGLLEYRKAEHRDHGEY